MVGQRTLRGPMTAAQERPTEQVTKRAAICASPPIPAACNSASKGSMTRSCATSTRGTRVLSADHPDTTKTLDQVQHCTGKSQDLN